MEADRYQQIKAVLEEVLELEPGRRFPFLEKRCADDSELRLAVETLLAAHDEAKSFLEYEGAPDGTFDEVEGPNETPGCVGPYKTMEKLGEGGMGVVYLAEQEYPIRRRVALKIIKLGMDTRAVIARFEAERQALALMNHPNVAKVLDAGATEQGRPYFAMEYVKGVPITEHCDRQRLTTQERLRLFMQVCEGVQHAHQKGIIHRDIKPSNILVQVEGDERIPKIIDFGVAKATQQRLTERTVFTELGQLIGTPEYMSPEQAEMTAEDIDTRTDVYSLGVLLYELLVGALPFDPEELRQAGFDEIRRRIREVDPPRPSARFSTLDDRWTESARKRRTEPKALLRELMGDLDRITMRALEKDRARRYRFPWELAEDIRRHLRDEPVLAHAPSAGYRARKFVRRHRLGVAAAVVMAVSLSAGAVASAVGLVRARRAEGQARHEAQAKGQVADFLKNLFKVSDPSEARGNSITARELLDKAAGTIDAQLEEQPETQADLSAIMAEVYKSLGLYAPAESLMTKALDIRKRVLGPEHPRTLASMNSLASIYDDQGRYREAERLHSETLEVQRRVLGPEHPSTLASMSNLALVYWQQGRYPEAERLHSETLAIRKRVLGSEHPSTIGSMINLAGVYWKQGRFPEAERLHFEALELGKRVLGPEHPETLLAMNDLADVYLKQNRYPEAERLYSETFAIRKRVLGPEHPSTLSSMNNLATVCWKQGQYSEAERLLSETLEIRKRVLGPEHPSTLSSMKNLALVYLRQGRYPEAERLDSMALEGRRRSLGPNHPDTLTCMYDLACIGALRGDRAGAIRWLRQAVDGGYSNPGQMAQDSDLEALHGPEFDALLNRARCNAAAAGEPADVPPESCSAPPG